MTKTKPRARFPRWLFIVGAVTVFLLFAAFVVGLLFWNGILQFNNPSRDRYPIRGVDVSSYQGEIDWDVLSAEGIDFAFIKATEGSSFVDPCLVNNHTNAQKTGLSVGFYHFFSYDSSGVTQAENFIRSVTPFPGMLPPVVDIEYYGAYAEEPKAREDVLPELTTMLAALEAYYGLKPILYATESSYERYLEGTLADYDIWIRNVMTEPTLSDGRTWTFWQYTNREKLNGYHGKETYIDMNVFHGDRETFLSYPRYTQSKTGALR